MLMQKHWHNTSRNIPNPGKLFFLQLSKDSATVVYHQQDSKGVSYARKAMVICFLVLSFNVIGKSDN